MAGAISFQDLSKHWGIALTGGIASGKSTVAESLRQRGFIAIDADQASRLVVLPGTDGFREVVDHFGTDILTPSGEMDRAKMREIVFQDSKQRLKLESIIHHRLTAVSKELLAKEGLFHNPRPWFYEASLIYERGRENDFSQVWVAYCPKVVQIARLMARDKIDETKAEAILAAQLSPELKRDKADRVLYTDCSRAELEDRVSQALKTLRQGASE